MYGDDLANFGIGPGDEVIVPAYTYTLLRQRGLPRWRSAKLIDVSKDSSYMVLYFLEQMITDKTKAIIPVDIGWYNGRLCCHQKK